MELTMTGMAVTDDYKGWNTYKSNDSHSQQSAEHPVCNWDDGAKGNNQIGVCGVNLDDKIMMVLVVAMANAVPQL